MPADIESIIEQSAVRRIEKLINDVRRLQANDYYTPKSVVGVTSNPPTDAELDSLLGTPASYNRDTIVFIKDTTNSRYWFVYGDTVNWFTSQANLAI